MAVAKVEWSTGNAEFRRLAKEMWQAGSGASNELKAGFTSQVTSSLAVCRAPTLESRRSTGC